MEIRRYIKASARLTIDLRREPTWTDIIQKVEGMNSDARADRRQLWHDRSVQSRGGAHAAPLVGGRHHAEPSNPRERDHWLDRNVRQGWLSTAPAPQAFVPYYMSREFVSNRDDGIGRTRHEHQADQDHVDPLWSSYRTPTDHASPPVGGWHQQQSHGTYAGYAKASS